MENKKILVIDDSVHLLDVLRKRFAFTIQEANVVTATTGKEGIELARSEKPDLIILDITLPDIKGDEVLKQLKKDKNHPETQHIPILILTSHGPEERSKYIALGAADYTPSPYDSADLITTVKKYLDVA